LLYEMIAGEGPFDDLSDVTQQMMAHLHRPPRPLHHFADLPEGLEDLIMRALSKLPADRPRSAEYMAAELAPFAGVASRGLDAGPASSPFSGGFAPISSPTPPGIVLNTKPPRGVNLDPSWHDPTLERASEPGRSIGSIPPQFVEVEPRGRRGSRGWRLGIGLTAALVGGLALATFASGSSEPAPRTAQSTASPVNGTTATATATTTATATATATATTTTTLPKAKPARKPRKRPARPATTDEIPVRLPVSGL
jgi:serine/threonine protein kinase